MIIGYRFSQNGNDSYMLLDSDFPRCPSCGMKLDSYWVNRDFNLKRRSQDLSITYDGYTIVSDAFREAVNGEGDVEFISLPALCGFYILKPNERIPLDTVRTGTRFEDRCDRCGRFTSVAGVGDYELLTDGCLPDRVMRTDVELGWLNEQHPVLLVGPGLGRRLLALELAGVDLAAIDDDKWR